MDQPTRENAVRERRLECHTDLDQETARLSSALVSLIFSTKSVVRMVVLFGYSADPTCKKPVKTNCNNFRPPVKIFTSRSPQLCQSCDHSGVTHRYTFLVCLGGLHCLLQSKAIA